MYRNIERIINAPLVNMGKVTLRQPLPLADLEQVSPFILLHHFDLSMAPGQNSFDVPAHPHRGFMPVTFVYNGAVEHEDSLGNIKVITDNEVQWINAARGIIHSEKTGKAFAESGGRFQGVQLWINLPAAEKMKRPSYQPLTKDEIVLIEEEGVDIRLVSGTYDGNKGPAHSNVFTAMLHMKTGSLFTHTFPAANNVMIYILEGSANINESQSAAQHSLIVFNQQAGPVSINAFEETKILLLSGQPINEPLVTHGPFVMNTQTEILEAMRDYEQGKMGFLY